MAKLQARGMPWENSGGCLRYPAVSAGNQMYSTWQSVSERSNGF